jgi:hypothetical protein
MKTLALILTLAILSLNIQAQMAELTFFYHDENAAETYNAGFSNRFCTPKAPEVNVKTEVEAMALWEFKKFGLYNALIEYIKAECVSVHSYKIVREAQRFDPEIHANYSGNIDFESLQMVRKAKDGDRYILYDIQVKNKDGLIYRIPLVALAQIKTQKTI